jgi:DNA-binding protein Alba
LEKSNNVFIGKKPLNNLNTYMTFIRGIYNNVILKNREQSIIRTVDVLAFFRKEIWPNAKICDTQLGTKSIDSDNRISNVSINEFTLRQKT